ncbi:MAG: HAD-IA family hydrolase [Aquincola sp.]|nr:HAD-IA family hydrolase [Aquincola sp.]
MSKTGLRALLWDVDGTLAETERDGHRVAFNLAFEACNLPWRWSVEDYGALLAVTGGRERLLHDMARRSDAPPPHEREVLARRLHSIKNARYAEQVAEAGIALREGVAELIEEASAHGVRLAIVTTTSRANVDALLRRHLGAQWQQRFAACVCGEDVQRKKPDPQAYHLALQALGLAPLQACALEDSPGGVAAARAADVPVVVVRSSYFADAAIDGAVAIGPSLGSRQGWRPAMEREGEGRVTLDDIARWCERMELVAQH